MTSGVGERGWTTTTAALLTGLGAFQAGLAMGAPWGRVAYGGQRPGRLPTSYRAVSAVAAVGYAAAAGTLATGSGSDLARRRLLTAVGGFTGVGVAMNGASRSRPERLLWTPTCAVTALAAWRARPRA